MTRATAAYERVDLHGTLSGYTWWKCREACCRKANADHQRAYYYENRDAINAKRRALRAARRISNG